MNVTVKVENWLIDLEKALSQHSAVHKLSVNINPRNDLWQQIVVSAYCRDLRVTVPDFVTNLGNDILLYCGRIQLLDDLAELLSGAIGSMGFLREPPYHFLDLGAHLNG